MVNYQYDAFISYRHRSADQQVAIALQNRLEQLKGADGKRLRIFRDKTDLPISSDLSDGIKEALESSRFLIVICTPAYQDSKWCMAELSRFRELHGNSNAHVLPVLVEGEPVDAFPEELFWEEEPETLPDGTIQTRRVEIEPLGADVRGNHAMERLRKLRTEYLRIAAPILGKSFDDLYQRNQRRQRWLWGSIITATLLGLTGFSLYNMHMRDQIQAQHQAMLANESLRLAVASEQQLQQGNVNLAMALALEALPENLESPERPLVPEAQTALRSAVYTSLAQRQKGLLQHITTVPFETWGWQLRGLYANGKILAVNDLERLYLYDTSNGNLLFDHPSDFYAKAILNGDATRLSRIAYADMQDGQQIYEMVICAIPSGEVLFRQTVAGSAYGITSHWDDQENICYFVENLYTEDAQILAAVRADGSTIPTNITPEQIRESNFRDSITTDLPPAMEIAYEDGLWTDLGKTYQEVLMSFTEDGTDKILISPDRELVLIYGGLGKKDRFYSLPGLESGNDSYAALDGYYSVDTHNKLLVVSDETALHLYRYNANNLLHQDPGDPWQLNYISRDGARFFLNFHSIWDTSDLSAPLFTPEGTLTQVSADLRYALVQTTQTQLQLWHTEQGLLQELETRMPIIKSCINADGSLLAVQYADTNVQVFDRNSNPVMTVIPPERTDGWNDVLAQLHIMELSGTDLLLSGCDGYSSIGCTWIVDTTGQRETVVLSEGSTCQCWNKLRLNHHFTEDGLFIRSTDYPDDALDAIYDIRTGQCIFRQVAYYQYDAPTGTLLYMPTNPQFGDSPLIHVARRNAQGVFQDLFTISPEDPEPIHWRTALCADDHYFIAVGQDFCQVYSLEDGTRLLTLYDSDLSEEYTGRPYHMVNGTIYDSRYDLTGQLTTYPVLEFQQVVDLAKDALTTQSGMRTLSYLEKEEFFLE